MDKWYGTFNQNCIFKCSASVCQIQGRKFKQAGEGFCNDTWHTGTAILGRLLISEISHWTLNFFLSPLNLCARCPHPSTPTTAWKLAFPSPTSQAHPCPSPYHSFEFPYPLLHTSRCPQVKTALVFKVSPSVNTWTTNGLTTEGRPQWTQKRQSEKKLEGVIHKAWHPSSGSHAESG